jgi:hypothetical protein
MAAASLYLAHHDSMTIDEGIHVASSYTYVTRGEYRFDPEHPPLFKVLSALPLLGLGLNDPVNGEPLWDKAGDYSYDSWREASLWASSWIYTSGNNADQMIFLSRLAAVTCYVGLGLAVWMIAKKWTNETLALYALAFTAFNPNLLAHGHLANTDVPLALTFLLVLAGLYRYHEKPSLKQAGIVGILLGISLATKFSALLLVPVVPIWFFYSARIRKASLPWREILASYVSAWLVIWAVYGFAFDFLPDQFMKGLDIVSISAGSGRSTYLFNAYHGTSEHIWYYFPVIFALKTQVIGVLLLLVAGLFAWKERAQASVFTRLVFGTTLLYLISAMVGKLNIGIRHITPLLTVASFAMAWVITKLPTPYRIVTITLYSIPVFWQFNSLIGFSSELIPRDKTYAYFNDSNLEWGEHSKEIAEAANSQFPGQVIANNYHWSRHALGYYKMNQVSFDQSNPPKGQVILVTSAQLSFPEYWYFRDMKPVYQLGHHNFFYRIP